MIIIMIMLMPNAIDYQNHYDYKYHNNNC